ncbi:uncharacterized protein LOC122624977 [Drosophila teissieri]|uniref:uncharacterized protein LOC122624977 n=1 Tax=Drosophila teissieri TaxID=7243 RepID=UPI001CBA0D64|nr:uncharacterized protein LOC122624977 [Drosophila teissieri]
MLIGNPYPPNRNANVNVNADADADPDAEGARSILRDSEVFANLLRFYDGICQWEEDSLTPILHIGWAKPLVNNITKFDYDIRSQVVIKLPEDLEAEQAKAELARAEQEAKEAKDKESKEAAGSEALEGNNNRLVAKEEKSKNSELPTTLADLTAACGEKILNPDFLLQGGGQPFADQKQQPSGGESENAELHNNNNNSNSNNNNHHSDKKEAAATATTATTTSNGSGTSGQLPASGEAQSQVQLNEQKGKPQHKEAKKEETSDDYDPFEIMLKRPVITLYSQKMKGLKDLLLAEKLNTHAISLQVTAQSVASRKVRGVEKQSATISATITAISSSSGDSVLSGVGGGGAGGGGSGSAVTGGASLASSSLGGDSIAASRPKRTRRE